MDFDGEDAASFDERRDAADLAAQLAAQLAAPALVSLARIIFTIRILPYFFLFAPTARSR